MNEKDTYILSQNNSFDLMKGNHQIYYEEIIFEVEIILIMFLK